MGWLIVIGVVLFVLAPIKWLKPNARQTRQNVLRAHARRAGVVVSLASPPLHGFKGVMPAYRWSFSQHAPGPDFVLLRDGQASQALEAFHAGWRWRIAPLMPLPENAESTLRALLERLPTDALVIESDTRALTLWWWESQGAERFERYREEFEALREALGGRADHLALSR